MDYVDATKIIKAVEKHRVIYDVSCNTYKSNGIRRNAWMKVADEVGIPVSKCQKKWKSIRDYYNRKRPLPDGSGTEPSAKSCSYFALLSFLDPFMGAKKSESYLPEGQNVEGIKIDEEFEVAEPSSPGFSFNRASEFQEGEGRKKLDSQDYFAELLSLEREKIALMRQHNNLLVDTLKELKNLCQTIAKKM